MCADARVAQLGGLGHVLVQRHPVLAPAQGKLRDQQRVDAVGGEWSLRKLCLCHGLDSRFCHRRLLDDRLRRGGAGSQQWRYQQDERSGEHDGNQYIEQSGNNDTSDG